MLQENHRKSRILYISHSASPYGAQASLYLLVKYLNKDVFEPLVVLPHDGPIRKRLEELKVTTLISPTRTWTSTGDCARGFLQWCSGLPERVQGIIKIAQKWDIDIIHSNVSQIFEGAIAAKLTGKPHICTVRGNFFAHPWLKSFISLPSAYETLDSLSNFIVPVSNAVKDPLSPFVAQDKLRVIYNGIEMQSTQSKQLNDLADPVFHQSMNSREPIICPIENML